MIDLPAKPAPNGIEPILLDYSITQRGAATLRVDVPGSRYMMAVSYPAMLPDSGRIITGRLEMAKLEGIRINVPLLVPQGVPGAPVVNGAGQQGRTINVRGFTPHYLAKEGYWLTIVEPDGSAYLHRVGESRVADASGHMALRLNIPLRAPFPDGARIEMGKPFMQGFIDGESWSWQMPLTRFVAPQFTVEEYR